MVKKNVVKAGDSSTAGVVGGGGMSRASKKRAKKKQKKASSSSTTTTTIISNNDNSHAVVAPMEPKAESSRNNSTAKSLDSQEETKKKMKNKRLRLEKLPKDNEEHDNEPEEHFYDDDDEEDDDDDVMDQIDDNNDDNDDDETDVGMDKTNNNLNVKKTVGSEPKKKSDSKKVHQKLSTSSSSNSFVVAEEILPPEDCICLMDIILADSKKNDSMNTNWTAKQRANCALNFLLQPAGITSQHFYDEYWEQKPLLIQYDTNTSSSSKQQQQQYYHRLDGLLSLDKIRDTLKEQRMCYGRDLNVTRYELDKHGVKRRVTLDLVQSMKLKNKKKSNKEDEETEIDHVEADPEVVWNHYKQGCTVRLLCPHKHSDSIHALLHWMELEWGCMVGANAYLTPPGSSQGFAPHYDDIEAFCLQLEGCKRWKVYPPLSKAETLPRQSSPDYTDDDLKNVEPILDVVLSPGDILYMPRGWIHQACTLPDGQHQDEGHSLHLTVSAMQQWAWVDLMEIVLPEALNAAAASETSTALREGLPIRFLDYMGAAYANRDMPELLKQKMEALEKEEENDKGEVGPAKEADSTKLAEARVRELQEKFRSEAKMRIMRVAKEAMDLLDASCDQISKQFMSARQPPALSKRENKSTSVGQTQPVKIQPTCLVRLIRPGVARLVLEDGKAVLYHCLENSRVYHERPLSPLEFELDDGPALEQLLATCEPQWICVQDLFHDTIEDKVGVSQALYDEGLLAIRDS